MGELPSIYENRVRFAETDLQGIVFYGTFFTYQDEALNGYLRQLDFLYDRMREEGFTTHIVHADMDYRAPAHFDEVIDNRIRVDRIGRSSLSFEYEAWREADSTLLAEGNVTHVTVDLETDETIPVPESLIERIVTFQERPPERA